MTDIAVNISSLVVALAALVFSIVSFKRQQDRAEVHARASVKPLLWIRSQTYADLKSIRILNHGLGPAVIKSAEFRRGLEGAPTNSVVTLFNLDIVWESFVPVVPGRAIPAEGEIVLVKQSLGHLEAQGHTKDSALAILALWQTQKRGVVVRLEYEDIYGNKMPVLEDVLA